MERSLKGQKDKDISTIREFVYRDGMRFEKTPYGLIFSPRYQPHHRKHHCPDCMECAWCSSSRCAVCRHENAYHET